MQRDHELPLGAITKTRESDIAVRTAGPTDLARTRLETCESLLGLFDAKALNDALVLSGWTLAEEVKILTDLVRGEPYTGIQKGPNGEKEVAVLTVDPKTRLAARKELRGLTLELATLNGIVKKMTTPTEHPQLSVTVKGNADGVMQLLQKKEKTQALLISEPHQGPVIDVVHEEQNGTNEESAPQEGGKPPEDPPTTGEDPDASGEDPGDVS